jgi:hypothetical protein
MRSNTPAGSNKQRAADILARFDRGDARIEAFAVGPDARGHLRLEKGAVHEWFGQAPAVGLLAGVAQAGGAEDGVTEGRGVLVWVGRACWPHAGWSGLTGLLGRSVFVDPASDADRLWAIDQALRCRGACVIADAKRLDMPNSRRLQLAAESAGTQGLLVRPPGELGELSAARTRWRVTPVPNPDARCVPEPRWTVELLRCKGLRPTPDTRTWIAQLNHDTGDVVMAPHAPDRSVVSPARRHA